MGKIKKTKKIRFTIDLPMDFPEDWDDDMVEFKLNESSWCCDNIIDLLDNYSKEHGCICSICSGKVIKD